jgi:hypothetical protein
MKIRNWMMAGVLTLASVLMLTLPVSAVTCPAGTNRQGSSASTLAECNIENDNSLIPTILNIIQVTIGVLALVAVIVIIFAGVQYTTSAGDAGKVKKAKDSILYGIIGLVIAILAFAIVNFVLSSLTKKPTTGGNSNNSTTNVKDKNDGGKAKVIDSEAKVIDGENKEVTEENTETDEAIKQIEETETRLNHQLEEINIQRKKDLALLTEKLKEIDKLTNVTNEKKQELKGYAQKEYNNSESERNQKIKLIKKELELAKKQKAQK